MWSRSKLRPLILVPPPVEGSRGGASYAAMTPLTAVTYPMGCKTYVRDGGKTTMVQSSGVGPSDEYLRQVANEFVTWPARSRVVFNTVAAVDAFAAFLAAYRQRLIAAQAGRDSRVSAGPPQD